MNTAAPSLAAIFHHFGGVKSSFPRPPSTSLMRTHQSYQTKRTKKTDSNITNFPAALNSTAAINSRAAINFLLLKKAKGFIQEFNRPWALFRSSIVLVVRSSLNVRQALRRWASSLRR
nr:hypothetical protein Iba_chr05eCG12860 [Ipomoea batatas]